MKFPDEASVSADKKQQLRDRLARFGVDLVAVEEQATKGSGPGGQKMNKTSSGVLLRYQLGDELIAQREALGVRYPAVDAALDEALAFKGGPVVISDGADNPGGGAASDATFILRRLIERKIANAALGPVWDPIAARIAAEAGEGARLMLRIGGKVSPLSGEPMDLECTVKAVRHEHMQTGLSNTPTHMGLCALVESGGVEILLCTLRNQAMGMDLFTGMGCDLAGKKIGIGPEGGGTAAVARMLLEIGRAHV